MAQVGESRGTETVRSVLITRLGNLYVVYSMALKKNGMRMQLDALKVQGCPDDLIFVDTASGPRRDRLGLTKYLETLQGGENPRKTVQRSLRSHYPADDRSR